MARSQLTTTALATGRRTIATLSLLLGLALILIVSGANGARPSYGYRSMPRSSGGFANSAYNSFSSRMRPTFGSSPGFPNGLRGMMPPMPPMSPYGNPYRFGGGGGNPYYQPPPPMRSPYGGYRAPSPYPSRFGSPSSSGVSSSLPSSEYSPPSTSDDSPSSSSSSLLSSSSSNSLSRPASSSFGGNRPGGYRRRPPPAPVSMGGNSSPSRADASPSGNSRVRPMPPTSPAPASTSSGALGPTVSNDADVGFDIPASSNSDSSSLAGPTVSHHSGAAEPPRTGPLSLGASSSLISSDGFEHLS